MTLAIFFADVYITRMTVWPRDSSSERFNQTVTMNDKDTTNTILLLASYIISIGPRWVMR